MRPDVHSAISASSASTFARRAWFVANRSSVASSGRPIAAEKRRKMPSPFAPIASQRPSAVGYVFYGAEPPSMLPVRSRTRPS